MPDAAEPRTDRARLNALRAAVRTVASGWSDAEARTQYHPELSPLAWHIGHTFFVETHWLREVVCGDDTATAPWRDLFFPELNAKEGRAARLPALPDLLAWTCELEAGNDALWGRLTGDDHHLLRDGYLDAFLRQHYAQHLETMALIGRQRALAEPAGPPGQPLRQAAPPRSETVAVPAGETRFGSDDHRAYDNEQPAHARAVDGFRIAAASVTNAEWLGFIEDGGYRRDALWTEAGRRWRDATGADAPQHWRAHPDGGWHCPDPAEPLAPAAPVHGLCAHEADAYAAWAGARLPHEHEWERAVRLGAIDADGGVWEWCGNALFPYPGFRAFPYQGYSMPWFDGGHRVLRGASRHTLAEVRRPAFRNFYPEGHRHVLAGLRLAW